MRARFYGGLFSFCFMNWQSVDERLIRRGELLLSLEFLERYDEELGAMNCGKVGRPFTLTLAYSRKGIGFRTCGI